ncbi:MAG: tetratricopeptide repeat protein [Verrucomicrobiia bacterium]|jgi:predicted Zn-dependent protease
MKFSTGYFRRAKFLARTGVGVKTIATNMPDKGDIQKLTALGYPEKHVLDAVCGWLELSCPQEARAEFQSLSAAFREHPEALQLHWQLDVAEKNWRSALKIAAQILQLAPDQPAGWIDRSYALHELGETHEAMAKLVPAYEMFPNEAVIPYNLACYCCQLKDIATAKTWFERAVRRGDKRALLKMALSDFDLEPLWAELESMKP